MMRLIINTFLFAIIGLLGGMLIASVSEGDAFDFLYWNIPSNKTAQLYHQYSVEKPINTSKDTLYTSVPFPVSYTTSSNIPSTVRAVQPGKIGASYQTITYLQDNKNRKLINHFESNRQPQTQFEIQGNGTLTDFSEKHISTLRSILDEIVTFDTLMASEQFIDYSDLIKIKNNLTVENTVLTLKKSPQATIVGSNDSVVIANIIVDLQRCNNRVNVPIIYSFADNTVKLGNYGTLVDSLCLKTGLLGFEFGVSCDDCTYYPVDRYHSYPNLTYDPSDVVLASAIPGGQYISNRAYGDLQDMYTAASKAGYYMYIVSGYRSYDVQYNTFESWVQVEIANGNDRATAESIAGSYAARPGYSEHQLGTTVDLGSQGCTSFSACNNSFWSWLDHNAYKYGFVLSYPPNTQDKTGYISEPWHYRWIGKEYAAEYNQVRNQYVPIEWLKLKNNGEI